jgi:DNA-binding NarL/FixJ family response regulator
LKHTILIVDDSALIRRSLRSFIETQSDWDICGEAENGQVAVEKVKQMHPEVVILDLQMPVMNGLEAARQINQLAPETAMLMFTMHNSDELQAAARAAGIRHVLSKSDAAADHLMDSLKDVGAAS